jgi:hemerythrin superfamily protein
MDIKTRFNTVTDKLAASLIPEAAPDEADILATLRKEHDEVQELLSDLNASTNGRERRSLVTQIRKALVPHTKAEEKIVYDAVIAARASSKKDSRKQKLDGAEGYLEHALASQTLAKLEKLRADSIEFLAAAKVLKELVDHHVQEEERNIWSDVKKNFDSDERVAMNRRFLAAKKRVKV